MTRLIARQLLYPLLKNRGRCVDKFQPAGIIVSILGALLVLFLWRKYKLHIPAG